MGIFKTIKIHSVFIWLKMDTAIRARDWECEVCALSKPALNTKIGLLASEVPMCPMEQMYNWFCLEVSFRSRARNFYNIQIFFDFSLTGSHHGAAVYGIAVHFFMDWSSQVHCL